MMYQPDLAHIHDAGFAAIATDAAARLLDELAKAGHRTGTVVDLGCGSGILAQIVTDAGYSSIGVDVSEAMIALARVRAPKARFQAGSFAEFPFPPCVAVCATGEVLNYSVDAGNDDARRFDLFRRIRDALLPGGIFLFDVAGTDRLTPGAVRQNFTEGSDWVVLAETRRERGSDTITRRIITFREDGARYRRDLEVHRLTLVDTDVVAASLRTMGFTVELLAKYGSAPLPAGVTAFLCRI